MTRNSVLITGAAGGIGTALCESFAEAGYYVIGTCRPGTVGSLKSHARIVCDLNAFVEDADILDTFRKEVLEACSGNPLKVLINNAAIQHLGETDDLPIEKFHESLITNTLVPFALTKAFLPELEEATGCVLNIGSVHNQSTKPRFVAYATSKTAMHGLTRAMAVDLGSRIRVNTLAPAATAAQMLLEGFKDDPNAYQQLMDFHPAKRIADPSEIGKVALFLCSDNASFLTGSTVYADGGVLSRLHDPL